MISSLWLAYFITLGLAVLWLQFTRWISHRKFVSNKVCRKIVHIGTGMIFLYCWVLFPAVPASRWLAASIPFAVSMQFLLIGNGTIHNHDTVNTMSRSGNRSELLKGPFFYGLVIVFITLIYWKESPIGVLALSILCAGDGMADLIGSRFSGINLPWSVQKSLNGSMAMFISSILAGYFTVWFFSQTHTVAWNLDNLPVTIIIVSFVCVMIESLPLKDIDNITVPLAAVIAGTLLMR